MKKARCEIRVAQGLAVVFIFAFWVGCGGSSEDPVAQTGGSGGSLTDASAGGDSSANGGSSTGGSSTGGTGTGGSNTGGSSTGGSSTGGTSGAGGSSTCALYHENCDLNNDQCCAPMTCQQTDAAAWCRAPQGDAAETCVGQKKDCTSTACCPGLTCLDGEDAGSKTCGYPEDGGAGGSGTGGSGTGGTGTGGSGTGGIGTGGSGTGGTGTGGSDAASCVLYHDTCDLNDDQCCAPMTCQATDASAWCRSPQGDAAQTCGGSNKDCSTLACCPGLTCVTGDGDSKTCSSQ